MGQLCVALLIVQGSLASYGNGSGALGNSTQDEADSSPFALNEGTSHSASSVNPWIDWSPEGFVG